MILKRKHFLDHLRCGLVMLVVFHHTAITYGAEGGWPWREITYVHGESGISGLILTLFCLINQAFFMGFLFLIAGYFTPPSFERKGMRSFLLDRVLRLGIPLLIYGFILGPVTVALAQTADGHPFVDTLLFFWKRGIFMNGPLWFLQSLLIFTAGYVVVHLMFRSRPGSAPGLPGQGTILLSTLFVGAAAFLLRLAVPAGKVVLGGLQIGYFAIYIFLFAIGCVAWRGRWLELVEFDRIKSWLIVSALTLPVLPIILMVCDNLDGFAGGWNIRAALYALWEPFVAWGIILFYLYQFRRRMNRESRLSHWLTERSYSVYIIHAPILVGISLALHPWDASPLFKFLIVGILTCLSCLAAATLLLQIPGARRVL